MELATVAAVFGVMFLLACGFIGYRLGRLELRGEIAALIRAEAQRVERDLAQRVETATRASSSANVLAKHAVASAERAEEHAAASAERADKAATTSLVAKHAVEHAIGKRAVDGADSQRGVVLVVSPTEQKPKTT